LDRVKDALQVDAYPGSPWPVMMVVTLIGGVESEVVTFVIVNEPFFLSLQGISIRL
jgi:hypothetical protein